MESAPEMSVGVGGKIAPVVAVEADAEAACPVLVKYERYVSWCP